MAIVSSASKQEFFKGFFVGSGVVVALVLVGMATGVLRRL